MGTKSAITESEWRQIVIYATPLRYTPTLHPPPEKQNWTAWSCKLPQLLMLSSRLQHAMLSNNSGAATKVAVCMSDWKGKMYCESRSMEKCGERERERERESEGGTK